MTTNREMIDMVLSSMESVSSPSITVPIEEMNVWDIIRNNKDKFEFTRSKFSYKGHEAEIYRLHMTKHIGKDMFKKLLKSPLIGGYHGTSYQKGVHSFVIYDDNIKSALQSILGVKNG